MANTSLNATNGTSDVPNIGTGGDKPINASTNEAVIQSAAEGRRLYIGNLAYATTEGELKEFFTDYLVSVPPKIHQDSLEASVSELYAVTSELRSAVSEKGTCHNNSH